MTDISMIVAAAANNVIGADNQLLWHIPEDFRYFKQKTTGNPVIMGRKTYDSIGRPLPNRTNIVISRNPDLKIEGTISASSLSDAISKAQQTNPAEIFILGGGTIYEAALQIATRVYLTRIHKNYIGDTKFPELIPTQWQQVSETPGVECDKIGIPYTFYEYARL